MIVPSELQDLSETMVPESSASSSARDNGDDHHTPSSSSSSSEDTPSRGEGTGDVAPKDLPAGFRFKAALHHEVADCAPSISGYKKLEEMVGAYHIPRTILLWTSGQNERACTVSQTGWILVYVDHFDTGLRFPLPGLVFDLLADYELALTQLTPNSMRFIIGFMLLCARFEVPTKAIVFREKSQMFKNVRNKVARWKRQFIFVRDTRTERISNVLAALLSKWRVPNAHVNYPQLLPQDIDLKNRLLEHARSENLIDLEALVNPELLAVFGFIDVANLFSEASASLGLTRLRNGQHLAETDARAETAAPSARRRAREGIESEDDVPLIRRRTSGGTQPEQAAPTTAALPPNAPLAIARAAAEPASPAMVQGMQSFVPPVDRQRARAFVQQHGGQAAMVKLMDAFSYAVALFDSEQGARTQNSEFNSKCIQLAAAEKASLVDDVNRLQGSEIANRAASAESQAEELASRNSELA
ncbi:hypothetical protein SLEP1_g39651 [Rubroshorea leprosula]|uniref:Transposase (putative) gypsy type domain-containing protein n=1 Tax=Rubroshorea leprosula TaxID=152421 RepID=A0AAV5L0V9_9ROSI|nr:hypothetical protein SLEP1_g39651 [Rubroshorea leprosula]